MDENKNDTENYKLKIIVVGDESVGKTSIIHRFCNGEFLDEYKNTICLDYLTKNIMIDNISFRLIVWDTTGSEKFRSISKSYYKSSAFAIIVYDISRKNTLENVINYIEDIKQYNGEDIYIILVGNKKDLEKREVSEKEGKEFAKKYGLKYFETSAKNGYNIEEIFIDSCIKVNKKIQKGEINLDDSNCGISILNNLSQIVVGKTYDSEFYELKKGGKKKTKQKKINGKRKCDC